MQLCDENYHNTEAEFHELSRFLIETYALAGRPDNWLFSRLEDWRYGGNAQRARQQPDFFREHAHLWRSASGALLGFCIGEYTGDSAFLQVHPQFRSIEDAMLEWLETSWAAGKESVGTYAYTYDTPRLELLGRRGYADAGESGRTYTFDLARRYPVAALPAGFRIATLAEDRNVESHIAAVRSAFGRATLDRDWFETKITAPSYAPEWELAVISPEGERVAFCLAWLDEHNQVAEIDPIGTRPEYQRRGLGKALVAECFRRLRADGMRYAYIGAGPEPAAGNQLYVSLGPAAVYEEHQWVKRLR
jgi:ribosomal protein S18 acetylase RimI-like enzyme